MAEKQIKIGLLDSPNKMKVEQLKQTNYHGMTYFKVISKPNTFITIDR